MLIVKNSQPFMSNIKDKDNDDNKNWIGAVIHVALGMSPLSCP